MWPKTSTAVSFCWLALNMSSHVLNSSTFNAKSDDNKPQISNELVSYHRDTSHICDIVCRKHLAEVLLGLLQTVRDIYNQQNWRSAICVKNGTSPGSNQFSSVTNAEFCCFVWVAPLVDTETVSSSSYAACSTTQLYSNLTYTIQFIDSLGAVKYSEPKLA